METTLMIQRQDVEKILFALVQRKCELENAIAVIERELNEPRATGGPDASHQAPAIQPPITRSPSPDSRPPRGRSGEKKKDTWLVPTDMIPWGVERRRRFLSLKGYADRDPIWLEVLEATAEKGRWMPGRAALILSVHKSLAYAAAKRLTESTGHKPVGAMRGPYTGGAPGPSRRRQGNLRRASAKELSNET